MKKIQLLPPFILFIFILQIANGQNPLHPYQRSSGWFDFENASIQVTTSNLFTTHAANLGLGSDDLMRVSYQLTDEFNKEHIRYRQFYKTYPVDDAMFVVQAYLTDVELLHGKIISGLNINVQNPISQAAALQKALDEINAHEYTWQNAVYEAGHQDALDDPTATFYPVGELKIGRKRGTPLTAQNYSFVWSFDISSTIPNDLKRVYVNAIDGTIFDVFSPSHDGCGTGSASPTMYNGNQSMQTWHFCNWCDWKLKDCRGNNGSRGVITKILGSVVEDNDNNWTDVNEKHGVSSHWIAGKTWDYFNNVHQYFGMNAQGSRVIIDHKDTYNTHFTYTGNTGFINVGRHNYTGGWHSTLDIIGHEFTHGVTHYTTGLIYENESGSLNESFSDIFGTVVQHWVLGGAINWTIGEDVVVIRSLSNPGLFQDPSIYNGTYWYTGSNQSTLVHTNSGVQNKWFYLLTTGTGTGNFNGVSVQGIGITTAARITFRSLRDHISAADNYMDAREASIAAAIQLYGAYSNEVCQVKNSWAAVGVGSPGYPGNPISALFSLTQSPIQGDNFNYKVTATVSSVPAGSGFWWKVCEIDPKYGTEVQGTIMENPSSWWIQSLWYSNPFPGYCCNSNVTSGYGLFKYGKLYRITRGTFSGNCVPWNQHSISFMYNLRNGQPTLEMQEDNSYNEGGNEINLSAVPNPTSGQLIVSASFPIKQLVIFDLTGRKVKSINCEPNTQINLNLSDLNEGVYILEASGENAKKNQKIVVSK